MTDLVLDRIRTALETTHTIGRELGGGGMARVFVATERALGRQVVIKTLPDDMWTPGATQRFHREILTAAQLQHPNIVPVLTAGDAGGMPYFTMPFVGGASLRERMTRGAVPLTEAVGILRDVARALAAAHGAGVIHRDIKPENILLADGAALVTDFGVAKAVRAATEGPAATGMLTAIGVSVGTPAYMAPEQLAADPSLDHRADLYAWGLVAYELLGGSAPFAGLSGTDLTVAQLTRVPPSLKALRADVPTSLADLVERCLAKAPADRPADAHELLSLLDQPLGQATAPPLARRRGLAVLAGVGATLLVGGAWWWMGTTRDTIDERVIAVAPFRIGGATPDVSYLREGLADIIAPQIHTVADRSAASMRVVLDRWRRIAGETDADLDDASARRVARESGAGQLILGDIAGTRDRLTVSARLVRVRDGKELAQSQVAGAADSISALASRVVTALLSIADGATQERLRAVLSSNPDALSGYLRGEQAFRRGRYADAGKSFAAAWQSDSTLAIAALRVHFANTWNSDAAIPGPWLLRSWTHRDRLAGPDSLLLMAAAGENFPEPTPLRARQRALQDLARRGNSAELWYQYGDFLTHNGSYTGTTDFWTPALDAFRRSEALDSSYSPALEHQAQGYLALGDTNAARAALRRQGSLDADGDWFVVNAFLVPAELDGLERAIPPFTRLFERRPTQALIAARLVAIGVGPDEIGKMALADSLLRVAQQLALAPPDRDLIEIAAYRMALNGGRPTQARLSPALLGGTPELYGSLALDALFDDGDSTVAAEAARAASTLLQGAELERNRRASVLLRLYLGVWALATGDTATGVQMERELRTRSDLGSPLAATFRAAAEVLAVQYASVARSANLERQLALADSLLVDDPRPPREIRMVGNFVLAAAYEHLDRPADALRVIQRRDRETYADVWIGDQYRRTARLAERLGLRDVAMQALRSFIALRKDAEPELQAEVEEARRRLANLEAQAR